jgi:integrase
VATISCGSSPDGKRNRRYFYGCTKKEALAKMRQHFVSPTGRPSGGGAQDLASFLADWLEDRKPAIEETSHEQQRGHVDLHIVPRLGHLRLDALTPNLISKLYRDLLKAGRSAALTYKIGITLSTALKWAARNGYIAANPSVGVPKPKHVPPVPSVWEPQEVHRFLAAVAADRLEALYHLAIDTGLRQGELFALRWSDLNLDAGTESKPHGTVQVVKSLAELSGRHRVKETKTKKGRRQVAFTFALQKMREHKERMRAEGLDVEHGLVFCDTQGGYLRKSNLLRRSFKTALGRAGLPDTRFHDLRHCCASLSLAAGVDTKTLSELLGHATPAFTAGTYQHLLPGAQVAAAHRLDAYLNPQTK